MDVIDEIITLMRTRPCSAYDRMDDAVLRVVIRHDWESGQWVMLRATDGALWGWLSWYLVDDASREALETQGFLRCIEQQIILRPGHHLYLANCTTSPDAHPSTYRALYGAAVARNPQAKTINAHLVSRRGIRWFTREGPDHVNRRRFQ